MFQLWWVVGAVIETLQEGALEGASATLAVVGTGLDRVYPAKHRALAHAIAEKGGIVSDF